MTENEVVLILIAKIYNIYIFNKPTNGTCAAQSTPSHPVIA